MKKMMRNTPPNSIRLQAMPRSRPGCGSDITGAACLRSSQPSTLNLSPLHHPPIHQSMNPCIGGRGFIRRRIRRLRRAAIPGRDEGANGEPEEVAGVVRGAAALWCVVVFASEVVGDDEAEVEDKDGDDSAVHGSDQAAGCQELFAAPEQKGRAEEDAL